MANPHDKLFKGVFGQARYAAAHFRRFLAPDLVARLDLDRAALQPGSFVDDALRDRHADLLYAVPWRPDPGADERTPALLYLLFEHQSTVDPLMAWRLLRYMVRIWERWLGENGGAASLPAILPLVLYHGAREWTAATRFAQLLELPAEVRGLVEPHVPGFELILQDLPRMPDRRLAGGSLDGLARLLLKHGRDEDLVDRLDRWAAALRAAVAEADGRLHMVALVVEYVMRVNEHVAPDALADLLAARVGPDAREISMTVADRLIQEGIAKGRAEGQRLVLLRLITLRFGAVEPETERRVTSATDAQVEAWVAGILTAASLDELLDT